MEVTEVPVPADLVATVDETRAELIEKLAEVRGRRRVEPVQWLKWRDRTR